MGVRGLATYFGNRDLFFDEVWLKDCKVIIDGNNLRFALYKWCPGLNHCFGGDYDKYARYVRQFMKRFHRSGIRPIVVFDGGHDKSDQKLATVISRMTEQSRNAVACTSVTQGKLQVFPLFGREVFQEVLEELGVEVIQCSFEADHVIAQMAIANNCPVISNDSDFYIFNVTFVSLDSLDMCWAEEEREGEQGVSCRRFNREKLLTHYGLASAELLHLLASLMGNDYIPPQVFERIFQNIKLPGRSQDGTERHRKIKGLLLFLAKERSADAALNQLLAVFPEKERLKLKARVLASMAVYQGADCEIVSREFSTAEGRPLPKWFQEAYHSASLLPWTLGIPATRKFFLSCQVESRSLASAHLSALPVYQSMVDLLTSLDTSLEPVPLYTRAQGRTRVDAVASLSSSNTPSTPLDTLRQESRDERREILLRALCPTISKETVNALPEELQLLSMVMHMWTKSITVSLAMVKAVLLCRLVLSRVDPLTGGERSTRKLESLLLKCDDKRQMSFYQCALALSPAFHMQEVMKTNVKKFDPLVVHSLSVFQAIAYASLALNKLLGNVFQFPRICDLFNGTFIYNISSGIHQLKKALLPDEVEEELAKNMEAVMAIVKDVVTENVTKSKSKKCTSKVKLRDENKEESEVTDSNESFSDLGNRFSALSVE